MQSLSDFTSKSSYSPGKIASTRYVACNGPIKSHWHSMENDHKGPGKSLFNTVKLKILSPPAGLLKQRALLRGGRSYAESLRPPRRTVRAGRAGTRLWNSMEFHIPCFFLWNFHIPCFLMELEWNQPLIYTVYMYQYIPCYLLHDSKTFLNNFFKKIFSKTCGSRL